MKVGIRQVSGLTVLMLLLLMPQSGSALAMIGGKPEPARAAAAKHGVKPELVLNKKGNVISERWKAPPAKWSMEQAKQLMPVLVGKRKLIAQAKSKDGGMNFSFEDDITVYFKLEKGKVSLIHADNLEHLDAILDELFAK